MKRYYITTPLYYVNDVPHIGHAYTTIAADVLARWKRMAGHDVFFLTGTDEHGEKIAKAAHAAGQSPNDFTNRIASAYKDLWSVLGISYDDFIRTTEDRHTQVVQCVFEKLKSTGDIYKDTYEGWYCVHDESYFSETELQDGKCPSCGRGLEKLKEESYFFRLSKYQDALLTYYDAHPEFLSPKNRASEIINFVKSGLKDLSVSRTRVKWGIPIPSDPGHVVYVWFDALLNYITAPGYNPAEANTSSFNQIWPADVHFVGKEIFRFHTVIWPAILLALKLPLPQKVFAHGWWTVEGQKMSKSLGNVVNPHEMAAEFGADAFRYFLLREVPFGSDGDFSSKALLNRYNTELANNIGNLLQRSATLLLKHLDGMIPSLSGDADLLKETDKLVSAIDDAYNRLAFGDVLDLIFGLVVKTNKYIDDKAPWKLGPDRKEELGRILYESLSVLKLLSILLNPFMPQKMEDMWRRLGENRNLSEEGPAWIKRLKDGHSIKFERGQRLEAGAPLFMRKGNPSTSKTTGARQ